MLDKVNNNNNLHSIFCVDKTVLSRDQAAMAAAKFVSRASKITLLCAFEPRHNRLAVYP